MSEQLQQSVWAQPWGLTGYYEAQMSCLGLPYGLLPNNLLLTLARIMHKPATLTSIVTWDAPRAPSWLAFLLSV